jgi:hypothetical protein
MQAGLAKLIGLAGETNVQASNILISKPLCGFSMFNLLAFILSPVFSLLFVLLRLSFSFCYHIYMRFCALMTPGWRAKETGCAFKWCFCQGSDKQWPNCESLENCWCLFNWTHSDSFLRVWIFFQCILVSEEDEQATFVEPSKRGRSFCLPSAVWGFIFCLNCWILRYKRYM